MSLSQSDIPQDILSAVTTLDVKLLKILLLNKRKGTATLLVTGERTNSKAVLKCISRDSPDVEKRRFENEIKFYCSYSGPKMSPEYISSGYTYLMLEYVDSITLREKISVYLKPSTTSIDKWGVLSFLEKQAYEIVNYYSSLLSLSEGKISNIEEATSDLLSIYGKLAMSGPFTTERSTLAKLISKTLYLLTRLNVKRRLGKLLRSNEELLKTGLTHHDLHLDNILVANSTNRVVIIDYATCQSSGLIIHDLVYYISTMLTLLEPRTDLKDAFVSLLMDKTKLFPIEFSKVVDLAVLFHQIGKSNSRFNSEASLGMIISEYLRFAIKILTVRG